MIRITNNLPKYVAVSQMMKSLRRDGGDGSDRTKAVGVAEIEHWSAFQRDDFSIGWHLSLPRTANAVSSSFFVKYLFKWG
jgi:hypothetical protein